VLCAAEIQEELRQKGDAELPEQRIQLRIGINIGDVIRKGNDVFGTGVNIAARLESLAEPGSIYISGEAYDQVRDRPFAFDDLGMKAVSASIGSGRVGPHARRRLRYPGLYESGDGAVRWSGRSSAFRSSCPCSCWRFPA